MKFTRFHKDNLVKLIKKLQPEFDEQTLDFKAYWDSSLNVIENYKNILATLNLSYAQKDLDWKGLEEEATKTSISLEEEHTAEVFSTELQKIASEKQPAVDKFFENAFGYLDTLIKGKTNCLVIRSEGGLGKTYNILKYLTKNSVDFKYVSGWITKLELYQYLHDNKNSLIVFDDCEIMLEDDGIVALLKPAIWETIKDKRIISYISSSEKLQVPKQFVFNGKIVMLINEVPEEERKTIKALMSRAIFYDLAFDYHDKLKLMFEIAKLPFGNLSLAERNEVAGYIQTNTDDTYEDLNLRTLIKGLDLRQQSSQWKDLLKALLVENEDLRCIKEAIKTFPTEASKQFDLFKQKTGKHRSTFFALKHKLAKKAVRL